ncbi:pilus assembly protein TadG-related protein [Streptomyces sp. RY43-2]|uniref:Pilus assembly protein TadG-related protein n=1 Tax=Streptomyces macrolidinus TaxID=2952607 RepID=A0ABT0ZLI6_9ACTN|nr:pilus assembly protein TadG-related protein [Streptomyces macrolidinus]MCN9244458.1 pilus assembly protein TadG-related protein [Streptomyces macrolidinus]
MSRLTRSEEGQAAPLYITVVVGLLFLALLYFVFGKADIRRNEAQTAADSAALAAAMESRDGLKTGFLEHAFDGGYLEDFLKGDPPGTMSGCDEALRFAARNGARTDPDTFHCDKLQDGRWGFTVELETQKTVGKSALPGTENKRAKARATAIVEPLCSFKPDEEAQQPGDQGEEPGKGDEKPSPGTIQCDGKDWIIDPAHKDLLPDLSDLFRVRLAEH